jgi:hypothetical protein
LICRRVARSLKPPDLAHNATSFYLNDVTAECFITLHENHPTDNEGFTNRVTYYWLECRDLLIKPRIIDKITNGFHEVSIDAFIVQLRAANQVDDFAREIGGRFSNQS